MAQSNLSVLGLYYSDPDLFDEMIVPTGVVKDDVINNILLECHAMEILYPQPTFLKHMIGVWSKAEQWTWQKLYATTQLDYNPIWNKDGTVSETETITDTIDETRTDNLSDATTGEDVVTTDNNLTMTRSGSQTQTYGKTDTMKVAGYDSNTLNNREQTGASGSDTVTYNNIADTPDGDITDTTEYGKTETHTGTQKQEGENVHEREYTRTETGNIGVTTTQQMIKEEREVAMFSIISYITDSFKKRFCLLVY